MTTLLSSPSQTNKPGRTCWNAWKAKSVGNVSILFRSVASRVYTAGETASSLEMASSVSVRGYASSSASETSERKSDGT